MKCIDFNYDIDDEDDEDKLYDYDFKDLTNTQYIYTFKTLGAQSYDNFLAMWTLNILAERESKNLKFEFSKEKFNFRLEQPDENVKWTEDFPDTITRLFEKIGISIKYETSEEVRQQFNRELIQYEKAKRSGKIRNQELFKNNLRAKGLQTKCYLCGCEVEEILEAAHLWGVADIKSSVSSKINKVLDVFEALTTIFHECTHAIQDACFRHEVIGYFETEELYDYEKYVMILEIMISKMDKDFYNNN